MTMRYTITIAISTPKDSLNYATKLQTITDDQGEPYFETISFGFSCEECSRKMDGEPCIHIYRKPASHKSIESEKMGKRLLGEQAGAELEAVAAANDEPQFAMFREETMSLPPIKSLPETIEILYSYIDMEAGGDRSEHAIWSLTRSRNLIINLGGDRYKNKHNDQDYDNIVAMTRLHYKNLFRLPWVTRKTIFAVAIEAQGGERLPFILKRDILAYFEKTGQARQFYFFENNPKKRPGMAGVTVNDEVKEEWTNMMKKVLSNRELRFLNRSNDPNIQGFVSMDYTETMNNYWDQFTRYVRSLKKPKEPQYQAPKKFTYGAKQDGCDDLITTQLGALRVAFKSLVWPHVTNMLRNNHITRP